MLNQNISEGAQKMEIFKSISPAKLQELMDHIRKDVTGWKAVDVTVDGASSQDTADIAGKLEHFFTGKSGAIFVCGARKVLTLGKFDGVDMDALRKDIARALPGYSCTINTGAVTREGLETIAIRLKDLTEKPAAAADLLQKRLQRPTKVFFVVDDDLFMRSLVAKVLKPYGVVHEFSDGLEMDKHYLREVPDVIFLDIHLPCGSGMDVLDVIRRTDSTAGVVMLSADRVKDNVLLSQARGAKGFVAKPFTKEKVEEAMRKCVEQATLMAR
jgi:two-component system chemotaxis response regulator CheY